MSRVRLTATIVHDRSVPSLSQGSADLERGFARRHAAWLEARRAEVPAEDLEQLDALIDLLDTALGERHARAVRGVMATAREPAPNCNTETHAASLAGMLANCGGRGR